MFYKLLVNWYHSVSLAIPAKSNQCNAIRAPQSCRKTSQSLTTAQSRGQMLDG